MHGRYAPARNPSILDSRAARSAAGISIGRAAGTAAVFPGFELAVLLDHRVSFGIAGYALATRNVHTAATPEASPDTLRFGLAHARATSDDAEANVTTHLRLGAGVTYRHVGHVDVPGITAADLRGVALRFRLRVGRF